MKNYKTNNSLNMATLNLSIIKEEKAETKNNIKKIKEQVKKNPNYINLCKNRLNNLLEEMELLDKEAKDTRRNIRKCRKALEVA